VLIAGRALRPSGEPLAAARLDASLWRGERDVMTMDVPMLADGTFHLVLGGRDEPEAFWLQLRSKLETDPASGESIGLEIGRTVPLPHLRGGARVDLGDLFLSPLPPLAAGIVVDDRGDAVPGAKVNVQQNRPRGNNENWNNLPQLATHSAPDGSFSVFGPLPPGDLRVRADTRDHFADAVSLRAAGQQLVIRIERTCELHGAAQFPDWLGDRALTLTMRPVDEEQRRSGTRTTGLQRRGDGRFVIDNLHAGAYDAIVTLRNVSEPLLTVPRVIVQPGVTRDPRLAALDLRQAIFRYRLRAVDAAGQRMQIDGPILARITTREGSAEQATFRWQDGNADIVTPSSLLDLAFFGNGVQPMRMLLPPGEHDVFMHQLRPAQLTLPGARAVCGPTRRVRVSVVFTGSTGFPESLGGVDQRNGHSFRFARWNLGQSSGAWLESWDTVDVPIMQSGDYEVILRVHATESTRTPQASVSLGTFRLDIDGVPSGPLVVPVDADALRRACESVDAQHQQALERQKQRAAERAR
jgi:hypothetical protein